ncbi:bifunctional diguanylate cyclase/phosphodiesterase [Vibrio ziniensis]|uniref:EAL domain-containing protein n=1 Tax=Vibrio ziniensis TaxID=2711221 RepID=A0A6G7CMP2_9VIBR|nr:cache domain-containing protein [Vibrio ziniensis]QIH43365.1 EAL domain-containing protein [Vibrio ziniensis]
MTPLNDRKLLNIIRYAPAVFITLFAVVVNVILIQSNRIESEEKIEFIRENLIEQQKQVIQDQIKQIADQIDRQKSQTEKTLQKQIYDRVYEAHKIASNIYERNRNKPTEEVMKMITEALRPIRFNHGRGYFFIYDSNGINVMHSLFPQLEGHSVWNTKDVRGTLIVQEHIARMQAAGGEAFYRWWYSKPDVDAKEQFEKIGFGKLFEPYGWYVGTGDYIVDVESDIKMQVVEWLQFFRYGDNDYVFIIDEEGTIVSHPEPSMVNTHVSDELGSQLAEIRAKKDGDRSGFTHYMAKYMPGAPNGGEKISYLKMIDGWDWTIGTGFYVQRFEAYLADNVSALEESNRAELKRVVLASLVSTLIIIALSLKLGRAIGDRFNRFQERIGKDFNELKQIKDKLKYLAEHDSLTDLPNRLLLNGIIHSGIDYAHHNRCFGAVMLLDVDDFKKINDLYGHSAGDKLLKTVSRKFESILGPHDTVSRFGGDEFIFCFPDLSDDRAAREKVLAIQRVFEDKFIIDGKVLTTNCSIGVAMFPSDDTDPEALIRKADVVLYKSKAHHKGSAMFYSNDVNEEIQLDYMIEEELRKALKEEEIKVLYQPQIDVQSGKNIGVEALARWNSKRLGPISPIKFIAAAEDIGVIHELGYFVFRKACEDILSISPNGHDAMGVSINISPKQLMEPSFPETLLEVTQKIGIDISRVTLEITENVLLEDLNMVAERLNSMKAYGFGLSLDDFGTGYSSLSYLNTLPITEIKIDRSFTDKILVSEQTRTLVKAIIAIGSSCKMTVVAEGVETMEQFNALSEHGCDVVQGYYFAPPLTIESISEIFCSSLQSGSESN